MVVDILSGLDYLWEEEGADIEHSVALETFGYLWMVVEKYYSFVVDYLEYSVHKLAVGFGYWNCSIAFLGIFSQGFMMKYLI